MTPVASPRRLLTLDCVRGVAALLVCMQHLRNATMVDFADTNNPFWAAFYFMTNLGHEAVMVFFVLSGFFVGGSVVRAGGRFQWADYLLSRLLRLWCVLLPCLVLTSLCDHWLALNAPSVLGGAFAETWHSAPQTGAYDASWVTALGNVFFMQTVWVPVFGSNGPLWSLANEAWYYLLFPLAWIALRPGPLSRRLLHGGCACLLAVAMPAEMRLLFLVWVLGVGVYAAARRGIALPRHALAGSAVLFAAAIAASRLRLMPAAWQPLPDDLVGVAFACFCLVLVQQDRGVRPLAWLRRGASWLSDMSFSLYLCHFPLVLVIAASNFQGRRMPSDAGSLLAYVGWLALLLGAGHAMWWCFERRTPAVRAWIAGWQTRQAVAHE